MCSCPVTFGGGITMVNGFLLRIHLCMEILFIQPFSDTILILQSLRIIGLGQFFAHRYPPCCVAMASAARNRAALLDFAFGVISVAGFALSVFTGTPLPGAGFPLPRVPANPGTAHCQRGKKRPSHRRAKGRMSRGTTFSCGSIASHALASVTGSPGITYSPRH